jgi:hypothetical protein
MKNIELQIPDTLFDQINSVDSDIQNFIIESIKKNLKFKMALVEGNHVCPFFDLSDLKDDNVDETWEKT